MREEDKKHDDVVPIQQKPINVKPCRIHISQVEEVKDPEISEEEKSDEQIEQEDRQKWNINEIPKVVTEELIEYKYRVFRRVVNSPTWVNVPDKNPKLKTFQCDGEDNFKGFKVVAEMDFSIPQIMCYLRNIEHQVEYNVPLEFA